MAQANRRAGFILSGLAVAFFTFVSHATVQPPKPMVLPPGIVSWWPGEGNANDIADGNNGTLLGGVTFSTAVVGAGFSNVLQVYEIMANS